MIWALFWKEWRENFKWMLLMFATFVLAEMNALQVFEVGSLNRQSFQDHYSLCADAFLMVYRIGCPLAAGLLGLLQFLPELRADRWAFLRHRPITGTDLFLGKALAGIALYLVTVTGPLALAVWWIRIPGHMAAPFNPGLLYPFFLLACVGLVTYCCALVVATRPARWAGTRFLPFLAAYFVWQRVSTEAYTRWLLPALIPVAIAAVLAAWGSVQTKGVYSRQPLAGRIALGVLLACAVWGIEPLIEAVGIHIVHDPRRPDYFNYVIAQDGQMLIEQDPQGIDNSYRDLEGRLMTPEWLSQPEHAIIRTAHATDDFRPLGPAEERDSIWTFDHYFLLNDWASSSPKPWYYLCDQRCYIRYDRETKLPLVYLGPEGLRPITGPPPHFAGVLLRTWGEAQLFTDRLYRVNFKGDGQISLLASSEDGGGFVDMQEMYGATNDDSMNRAVLVLFQKEARIIAPDGTILCRAPYTHDPRIYGTIRVGMTDDHKRFYFWYHRHKFGQSKTDWILDEVDSKGSILKEQSLTPFRKDFNEAPLWKNVFRHFQGFMMSFWWYASFALWAWQGDSDCQFYWWKNWHYPLMELTYIIANLVFGTVCCLIARRMIQRHQLGPKKQRLWTIVTFLSGPPGLAVFFLVHNWKNLAPCPSCSKPRRQDLEHCPHCGAGWPEPESKGYEVFERVENEGVSTAPTRP